MKRRYTDLSAVWHRIRKYGCLVQHEARVKITPHSRIYLKLVVFADWQDMNTFFNKALHRGDEITSNTAAICTDLTTTIKSYRSSQTQLICEMDRKWFAAIGLIAMKRNRLPTRPDESPCCCSITCPVKICWTPDYFHGPLISQFMLNQVSRESLDRLKHL